MSAKPPIAQGPYSGPNDRRDGTPIKRGSLRWVRNVLRRSLSLERRSAPDGSPAEPRGEPGDEKPLSLLMQQRAELGARLLVHDPATQVVRHLFLVHDELRAGGWASVEALPVKVLERALTEAEILASDEPSNLLVTIIESLRTMKAAADIRALKEASQSDWGVPGVPEVSDTNFDEYELMERSWAGTVPAGLDVRSRLDSR